MDLNFEVLSAAFLCFDQPIVIKTIAIILIRGCSNEVNRKAAFFISPKAEKPNGDRKYKINPTNNCMWVAIKPNKAIFRSLAVNSFLEENPKALLTTATIRSNKAKYAHPEWNF